MASCTQIAYKIQAYVDGELSQSQRLICDQHFTECRQCRALVQEHQRLSASLFEAFADFRLVEDLSPRILDHLPVRYSTSDLDDLAVLNWRAKHPQETIRWIARSMPVAAAVLIVVLGAFIYGQWPREVQAGHAIGMVVQAHGAATYVSHTAVERENVSVAQFIEPNDRFETGAAGAIMLALAGQTTVKMQSNTRVSVDSERVIRVESGEAYMDVGHDDRLFKVRTALGTVTVFGTAFNVRVSDNAVTVTVTRGTVQLDNNNGHFQPLGAGEQATIVGNGVPSAPVRVDTVELTKWAASIVPDERADRLFRTMIVARGGNAELAAKAVYLVDVSSVQTAIRAIRLEWTPEIGGGAYCNYDMYVYDEYLEPLFSHRLTAAELAGARNGILTVDVPGAPIEGKSVLSIRLVPNVQSGGKEAKFSSVWAVPL